ncbi:hypothetical protein GCM10023347_08670 [Streptomyces chumphonensis]|uniref:DUF1707 and DUF2154 domain-containing protein n=1 Tax=Streptomyces chumphonensis TaxID=1214925 RepID=A0A927EYJ2_9ACTN|nr:DUF1707 domain-containing protein [Streptomyces chumphonensis]MBD3932364.1 DUF1707 and DUF2154 domain-containing protein [Streptomyces chumphonensis]
MTDASRAPVPHPDHDPGLRASDADREAVAEVLREAAGDGRIDLSELHERLERTFEAKTYGELAPLTADLPGHRAPTAPPPPPSVDQPMVLKTGAGDITQTGHWEVPRRISAHSRMGSVKIDFSQAVCRVPEVALEVKAGMGDVTIVVPHGWSVRTHGVRAHVGSVRNKAVEPPAPGAPTLEVTGSLALGEVLVRYPNRWEQWLRRRDGGA